MVVSSSVLLSVCSIRGPCCSAACPAAQHLLSAGSIWRIIKRTCFQLISRLPWLSSNMLLNNKNCNYLANYEENTNIKGEQQEDVFVLNFLPPSLCFFNRWKVWLVTSLRALFICVADRNTALLFSAPGACDWIGAGFVSAASVLCKASWISQKAANMRILHPSLSLFKEMLNKAFSHFKECVRVRC